MFIRSFGIKKKKIIIIYYHESLTKIKLIVFFSCSTFSITIADVWYNKNFQLLYLYNFNIYFKYRQTVTNGHGHTEILNVKVKNIIYN